MSGISVQTCVKMVSEAAKQCAAPTSAPTPGPNFDALAASLAAQANAIASQSSWLTFGGVLLAVVALIAGVAWGRHVATTAKMEARRVSEREARKVAQACADAHIKKWLEEVAQPLIKREAIAFLRTLGAGGTISDFDTADLVSAAGKDGKEGDDGKQ
jgi:hypothetical protein